jgi:hypothetical protein
MRAAEKKKGRERERQRARARAQERERDKARKAVSFRRRITIWLLGNSICATWGLVRCRTNLAQIGQSRPDSGLGLEVQVLSFKVVPSSLGSSTLISPRSQNKLEHLRGQVERGCSI